MEVVLKLGKDDSDQYGIMNIAAVDMGFDSFWEGNMFFHDVFEHWFEEVHFDFTGVGKSFNIGGEIAATGACLYYMDKFSLPNRSLVIANHNGMPKERKRGNITYDGVIDTTHGMIEDLLDNNGGDFDGPLTKVKHQKEFYSSLVTMAANYNADKIKELLEESKGKNFNTKGKLLLKSLTPARIHNLIWWGANQAKKLVPYEGVADFNRQTMIDFIDFWDNFCYNNEAKKVANLVNYITINLNLDEQSILTWSGTFRTSYDHQEIDVRTIHYIDDFYDLEDPYDD